jgi:hypothetical protein
MSSIKKSIPKEKLRTKLESLERTHSLLNNTVDQMQSNLTCDAERIGALKLKKLHLKDEISRLQKELNE